VDLGFDGFGDAGRDLFDLVRERRRHVRVRS
jgi:hypothetical protein